MWNLLAAVAAVAIGIVLWRLLRADNARVPDTGEDAAQEGKPTAGRRVVGPDDDPEFLRSLGRDDPGDQ